MSNNVEINQQQQPSFMWKIIKQLFIIVFPGIRLLKINSGLKRVNQFYKHEWFDNQRKRNILISLLVSLPFLLCLAIFAVSVFNADQFWFYLAKAKTSFFAFEISKTFDFLEKSWTAGGSSKSMAGRVEVMGAFVLVGLVISFVLGTIVILSHPLIKDTKKLYEMLQRNGVIDKDDKSRLVLATPLGFLIDITGNTAREIKDSERIWMALNQRVTDWSEDPNQRAICFFKKAYNLKPSYKYSFKKEK